MKTPSIAKNLEGHMIYELDTNDYEKARPLFKGGV
jgi:hypothetical protein